MVVTVESMCFQIDFKQAKISRQPCRLIGIGHSAIHRRNGCCTANAQPSGFLIDVEENTKERFGSGSGTVEWTCLDCE